MKPNPQSMLSISDDSFSPTMFSAKQDILLLWSCEDKLDSRSTETWPDVKIWECERANIPAWSHTIPQSDEVPPQAGEEHHSVAALAQGISEVRDGLGPDGH